MALLSNIEEPPKVTRGPCRRVSAISPDVAHVTSEVFPEFTRQTSRGRY